MNVITKEFLKTEESIYNLSKRLNIPSEEIIKQLKEDGFILLIKSLQIFYLSV